MSDAEKAAEPMHPNRSRRIWRTEAGTVCLRWEDDFGHDTVREFWAPSNGGYVREIDNQHPGTLGVQVCDRLAHSGYTLSARPDTLERVIRREYRRMVVADRRRS
jgi:hypothetical protein